MRSDRRFVRRLLQNLISNALKYTSSGRVLVGCRRRGNRLVVSVHDTGPGIPEDQRQAVFREFKRLAGAEKMARGLGLGLSIVERLARLLGTSIDIESAPGKGSAFSFDLPISVAAAAHADAPQVARVVGAQDLGVAGRVGDAEVVVGEQSARAQAGAQQGIFLHRKAVPIGQRQDENVRIEDLHSLLHRSQVIDPVVEV